MSAPPGPEGGDGGWIVAAGAAGVAAGLLGAALVPIARRRRRVSDGGEHDAVVAADERPAPGPEFEASPLVRPLVLPASFDFSRREARTLTPLDPQGYILIEDHLAVLAEAVSSPFVERDQLVHLASEPVDDERDEAPDHPPTEGPDA